MPIYEYQVAEGAKGCPFCTRGFEQIQTLAEPKLEKCPECGAPVVRVISAPSLPADVRQRFSATGVRNCTFRIVTEDGTSTLYMGKNVGFTIFVR